ncbi:MAG: DUF302 domain-containing protein [Acidimicrobiales bacterium]
MAATTPPTEIVTKESSRSVGKTVERFVDLLSEKDVKVFTVIDQREEAQRVGLDLRETVLVLFGNPRAGTPVMVASPLVALELPLRIVIWSDNGQTKVSYESPISLGTRYQLAQELVGRLEGINSLTDALVA